MIVLLNALQAGNRSGTGRYTWELARWAPVVAEGLDVAVLWPEHVPRPGGRGIGHGACVPCRARHAAGRLYMDQVGIRRVCSQIGADVVHYPASVGSLTGLRNSIVTVHDLSFLHNPGWFRPGRAAYYRYAVGRSARMAGRVIADSEATAADLEELVGLGRERVDVIPLGVDEAYRPVGAEGTAALRAKYGLPERYFLYVGTLEPRKNVVRLVEAWSRIADVCECDLVIAGREGWKVGQIRRVIAGLAQGHRVHRPGFIAHEDLPGVICGSRAFVWPSLWEGFGLPPLEAMACGVPVLTSNVSSLPEVVGDAALTVDPYDVEAIADGMRRLADDEALRDGLKERGVERAGLFTWHGTAEATVETYRKVLGL